MNFERITEMLAGLRILPFFPADEYALLALVQMVGAMATTEDQVRWLVARMTSGIYAQWPGPHEMRACFCSKFKPKDGINVYSTVYLDGIPAERPALPPAAMKALPAASDPVLEDRRMEAAVKIAKLSIALKDRSISGPATPEEIAAAPEWLRRLEGYDS